MAQAIYNIVPVMALLVLGYVLGRRRFLSAETNAGLKKLVVNLALPAALLLTFLRVQLEARLALIPLVVFSACLAVFVLARRLRPTRPFFPFLMTGFEAGMLGYALFGAVFGPDKLYTFGLVDLGQVVFVFFVLIPALQRMQSGKSGGFWQVLGGFVRTPVILAILLGVLGNALGLYAAVKDLAWYGALHNTLSMLGGMTAPLAALVIGSEIRFQGSDMRQAAFTAALRLLVWLPLALLFNALVINRLLGLDALFQTAVLCLAVLPAPFVVPLYLDDREQGTGDSQIAEVVNTLTVQTLLGLISFVIVVLVK
jgi:predicted permease